MIQIHVTLLLLPGPAAAHLTE